MEKSVLVAGGLGIAGIAAYLYLNNKPSIPPEPYFTWEFPSASDIENPFIREIPAGVGEIDLFALESKYLPKELSVVWSEDATLWWRHTWPESTLRYLLPLEGYIVIVTGLCSWHIPY